MLPELTLPWHGPLNWAALAPWPDVLARRTGDRGEWWIGVGRAAAPERAPAFGPVPCFGFAGYDLKNEFEPLVSRHPEEDGFPVAKWWAPRFTVHLLEGEARLYVHGGSGRDEGARLMQALLSESAPGQEDLGQAAWTRTTSKEQYLRCVEMLLDHIRRGDIYEVNYCTRRTAQLPGFDPFRAFARLMAHTDAPFGALLRDGSCYALCASPERFLRMDGARVITQPMKGTRPRGRSAAEDRALAGELATDPKERSENIMAVDVARNDLARIAAPASVLVEELCAVKTFPNVLQLVSTVAADIRGGISPGEILRATFPMASMTGAPKIRAMQLADALEDMRRGLYSGTMGYFLPDGTADLNVVIRTITWDAATGRASLITGGAITAGSDPLREFEECEHKARSVLNAFGHAG